MIVDPLFRGPRDPPQLHSLAAYDHHGGGAQFDHHRRARPDPGIGIKPKILYLKCIAMKW